MDFFLDFFDIIGQDIHKVVEETRLNGNIFGVVNATRLNGNIFGVVNATLILKKD
jgi:hypothetical protein